jgi:hypothetical protein
MPDDLDQVTAPKRRDHKRVDPASSSPEPDVQRSGIRGAYRYGPVASHTRTLPGMVQLRSDVYCRTGISCQIPRVSITAR